MVVRFKPIMDAAATLRSAQRAFREQGHHRLSVFADAAQPHETEEDLLNRLLDAAELSHILRTSNPKFWFSASAASLLDDGFVFVKDGYDGEVAEHWSIDLGNTPSVQDTERLASHFTGSRRWV